MGSIMRSFLIFFIALCACNGEEIVSTSVENSGYEDRDHFIDDYFGLVHGIENLNEADEVSTLRKEKLMLTIDDADMYKRMLLNPSREEHVLVFLSTSLELRKVFENAVLTMEKLPNVRLLTAPLSLEDAEFTDQDVYRVIHKLPSKAPGASTHIIAHFLPLKELLVQMSEDVSMDEAVLAVHKGNAYSVDPKFTADQWQSNLKDKILKITTKPAPVGSMEFPSLFVYGAVLYLLFVVAPRIYSNREFYFRIVFLKRTWFFLSLFVMYLSLSGTFYTVIHGSPLFYLSGNGNFALIHPSGQRQFALEGLFGGTASFIASSAFLVLVKGMPYILGPENRVQCIFICFMAVSLVFLVEHVLFTSKNRWYRLTS